MNLFYGYRITIDLPFAPGILSSTGMHGLPMWSDFLSNVSWDVWTELGFRIPLWSTNFAHPDHSVKDLWPYKKWASIERYNEFWDHASHCTFTQMKPTGM